MRLTARSWLPSSNKTSMAALKKDLANKNSWRFHAFLAVKIVSSNVQPNGFRVFPANWHLQDQLFGHRFTRERRFGAFVTGGRCRTLENNRCIIDRIGGGRRIIDRIGGNRLIINHIKTGLIVGLQDYHPALVNLVDLMPQLTIKT